MASFVHTTWVNLYTSGPTALSGSNDLWLSLETIYEALTGYWNTADPDNTQYIINWTVITGVDICERYDPGTGSLTAQSGRALSYPSEWTSAFDGFNEQGVRADIIITLPDDCIRVVFKSPGGDITFGYQSIDAGGPYNLASGSPVEVNGTGALSRTSDDMGRRNTWWNLIGHYSSSANPSGNTARGLNNPVFDATGISGQDGWLTRFASPYVGIKSVMYLYDAAQWSSAGWYTTSGGETLPCAASTSGVLEFSAYIEAPISDSRYMEAYGDSAEYLYGWSTAEGFLFTVSGYWTSGGTLRVLTAWMDDSWRDWWETASTSSWDTYIGNNWQDHTSPNLSWDKYIFTGPDSVDSIVHFREAQTAAGLRLQWDKEGVHIPLSSISEMSGEVWDESTINMFKYLTYNYETYKYVREFL